MRLRRLVSLAAAAGLAAGVLTATPARAAPEPPAPQSTATQTTDLPAANTQAPNAQAPNTQATNTQAAETQATETPAAQPLSGIPEPDYTPGGCNRSDLPAEHARCLLEIYTPKGARIAMKADQPRPTALTPEDIRSAYKLPDGGEGQTVAVVVAHGNSAAESDLAVYRSQYGLPECTTANGCFRKVDQKGGTDYPPDDAGWAAESALDLDAVSAVCPRCKLLLVQADSASVPDLTAAVDTAVALGAKFVSNSYGIPGEADGQQAYDKHYDHPGVVVTAATGDIGNISSWPASNPNVVAVGGTRLTRDASAARGWSERPWTGGGSGCSPYEPRPAFQEGIDTNCPNGRATADISADADPASGLSVYHSFSSDGYSGWLQYGGTSLSAPLVAAMYALAGTPTPGTYPVTYPYAAAGLPDLFDITEGSNGVCGNVLCEAGPGWDGPTGLGTPNGLGALTFGPAGTLAGTLTDQATGVPIGSADVSARNVGNGKTYRSGTDGKGGYTLLVPAGTYDLTATGFGYAKTTSTGVAVPVDQKVSADFPMRAVPSRTVSGTITGDGDRAWPLAASIAIDGYPHGRVRTDPYTGRYSVELPKDADYTFRVSADYPGYTTKVQRVSVPDTGPDTGTDASLSVDRGACLAPGYDFPSRVDFEGWSGTTPQDGWTVSGSTPGWDFTGKPQNLMGSEGNFAAASPFINGGTAQDTYLTSPAIDLSGESAPTVRFNHLFIVPDAESVGEVQLSLDGGATWSTVGGAVNGTNGSTSVAIPQAAGRSDARVRFHFASHGSSVWQLDDITVGSCVPQPGGLVSGVVTDANTGEPVPGASVGGSTPSTADGWYWAFAGKAGKTKLTASAGRYASSTGTVTVAADKVTRRDWTLRAGRLSADTTGVSFDATLGRSAGTRKVRLTNTGGAPLKVTIGEHSAPAGSGGGASDAGWTDIADYPLPIANNAAGSHAGKLYSAGGWTTGGRRVSAGYVYDPATGAWSPIADLPQALLGSAGAFLDGVFYVFGGEDVEHRPVATAYAYHPDKNAWTRLADLPTTLSKATAAVLGKHLYVVGGCVVDCGTETSAAVYRYDPRRDTWTRVADYPSRANNPACAGLGDQIICAGGRDRFVNTGSGPSFRELTSTYAYNPRRNAWTALADMPYQNYGMAFSGANGRLQVAGGISNLAPTGRAAEFDPVTGTWRDLPDMRQAVDVPGSGCGLYKIGGTPSWNPAAVAEVLPGYDSCGGDDVAWLKENHTELELAPGRSATLTVKADAHVSAAGRYTANLSLDTDSPYRHDPIDVVMRVKASGKGH
ncbi:galactose oxidase [Nonomuraea sp. MG754425]|uniref:carboxypeptidase regulatory-like domain-containing protein n=1 Tax=Nonomuraea sp. MG754425 TaxID=2570319 RepID=UPI001F2594C0|nr:carboxypeptidase regulatory-like domain-containing protein [Nonomuraea sp. MG754425]MCF6468702.1 galactose oxidase [Nonomuraea sp. MG754425]